MKKGLFFILLLFVGCIQTDESPTAISKILAARQRTHEIRMQELNNLMIQVKEMKTSLDNEKRLMDTLSSIKIDSLAK